MVWGVENTAQSGSPPMLNDGRDPLTVLVPCACRSQELIGLGELRILSATVDL